MLQNSRKEERLIVFNTCVSLIYYGEGLENILIFKQLYQNATIGKKILQRIKCNGGLFVKFCTCKKTITKNNLNNQISQFLFKL